MNLLRPLWRSWQSGPRRRTRCAPVRRPHRPPLRLEPLEGRMLLSDGTAAGTVLVKDINPGGAGSNPGGLIDVNGTLFFAANDGTHGTELWKSDGTASGTVLVADIDPGSASSYPTFLTVAGRHLFF